MQKKNLKVNVSPLLLLEARLEDAAQCESMGLLNCTPESGNLGWGRPQSGGANYNGHSDEQAPCSKTTENGVEQNIPLRVDEQRAERGLVLLTEFFSQEGKNQE